MIEFIRLTIHERGYPPTVRELADHYGLSTSTVHDRLRKLQAEGVIRVEAGRARAITIVEGGDDD